MSELWAYVKSCSQHQVVCWSYIQVTLVTMCFQPFFNFISNGRLLFSNHRSQCTININSISKSLCPTNVKVESLEPVIDNMYYHISCSIFGSPFARPSRLSRRHRLKKKMWPFPQLICCFKWMTTIAQPRCRFIWMQCEILLQFWYLVWFYLLF
jgi:hypothetical protein